MSKTVNSLTVFLAAAVGCLLTLQVRQPATASPIQGVSYGQNPVVAIGGTAYDGETKTLLTAPASQDLVITDLVLTSTSNGYCVRSHKSDLMLASGSVLGQFETTSSSIANSSNAGVGGNHIQLAMRSGLRVPAGDSLQLVVVQSSTAGVSYCGGATSYGVRYMISGYTAHP